MLNCTEITEQQQQLRQQLLKIKFLAFFFCISYVFYYVVAQPLQSNICNMQT